MGKIAQIACSGHDIVFNCAGLADVDLSEDDPGKAFDENVTTASLLALATIGRIYDKMFEVWIYIRN